jgi:O-antigen biosynthesis protein
MPKKLFNPLEHAICLSQPAWVASTAWMEHIPFGMFIVSAIEPKVFVELGTWYGVSYCAFCQAVKELKFQTHCYAIDSWEGDEHAGNFDEEALFALHQHHDANYADFSCLIKSTFEDALMHFSDSSIDLLHIDGFHSYDAVRKDFESWLPKMSESGIILFHDVNVHERGFGAYKLWEEISTQYPSFDFLHGHGLGILAVGREIPHGIKFLFESGSMEKTLIREFFFTLGSRLEAVWQMQEREKIIREQDKYIKTLQTYEEIVKDSYIMRGYRRLKDEGFSGLYKKNSLKDRKS